MLVKALQIQKIPLFIKFTYIFAAKKCIILDFLEKQNKK